MWLTFSAGSGTRARRPISGSTRCGTGAEARCNRDRSCRTVGGRTGECTFCYLTFFRKHTPLHGVCNRIVRLDNTHTLPCLFPLSLSLNQSQAQANTQGFSVDIYARRSSIYQLSPSRRQPSADHQPVQQAPASEPASPRRYLARVSHPCLSALARSSCHTVTRAEVGPDSLCQRSEAGAQ